MSPPSPRRLGKPCADGIPAFTASGYMVPAHTSEQTYNDCYKGKLVQLNHYFSSRALGGYFEVAWADTKPSNADCAESYVAADLFELRNSE